MYIQKEKPKENISRAIANSTTQKKNSAMKSLKFIDNRTKALTQRQSIKRQRMSTLPIIQRVGIPPTGTLISDESEILNADKFGMKVKDTHTPDNISPGVKMKEQVGGAIASGSLAHHAGFGSNVSGWLDVNASTTDDHTGPRQAYVDAAEANGNGTVSFLQNELWKAETGDCAPKSATVVLKTGYRIKHELVKGDGTKVTVKTTKSPEEVALNNFTAEAGASAALAVTNTLKD